MRKEFQNCIPLCFVGPKGRGRTYIVDHLLDTAIGIPHTTGAFQDAKVVVVGRPLKLQTHTSF